MVTVKIQGELPIDETAAELLNVLSSSRFTREVYLALPHRIRSRLSMEAVALALNEIHCRTAGVLRQRNAAERAIALQR